MEISLIFQNEKRLITLNKPLVYTNIIEILKNFGDVESMYISMGLGNKSDFLVPLECEQDFDDFLKKHKNLPDSDFEKSFELNINRKEIDITAESRIQDGIFIPESFDFMQSKVIAFQCVLMTPLLDIKYF